MEFRILGPLEVRSESGMVALGGVKPRAVLAVLLLHANESVHAERLALALWGEDAPTSAVKTLQVYVSRLRKALDDSERIATTSAGYRLRVEPGELDAERFELLVEEGRLALAAGEADQAAAVLDEALGLWRGPALEDVAYEPFARAEIARLEERRLVALEARVEADLNAGRHGDLVGELQRLVAANPTRERLAGQLMRALYCCGRQAEALAVFSATRRRLIDDIGVEPGPELRRLQEAILRQDAWLEPQQAVAELPRELDVAEAPPLLGREVELAWLKERWERARVGEGALIAVIGIHGIGKSRLAAELARDVQGVGAMLLYATGTDSADRILSAVRRAAGATRPTLLVVDDADQAGADVLATLRELPRGNVPVLVLATGEDSQAIAPLDTDGFLTLEPLDGEAVRAVVARYVSGRTADEVPVEWLLQASDGIPGRVHEVAGEWARQQAERRVGAVAGRTAAGRADLRSMEAELADDVVELQAARERVAMAGDPGASVVCPFKGLASFDVDDAPYFSGREKLVAELVARLVGAHLLGIVGPSGSGKSSVMRAGLLPALAGGVLPGSEMWKQVLIRPGEHPLRELTDEMEEIGDRERVVIAVDQFEETFTTCGDEAERAAFVDALVRATRERDDRGVVVIALRADFYGRCAAYPQLAGLLASNHVLVGLMSRDELRRAIELPAQRVGLHVDRELVDELVADVHDEPGGLPLLSTALLELWQHRDGRRLRYTVYEQTGGVCGAVARLAEDAFGELDGHQRVLARSVLMRLVGEGAAGGVERRRVALAELETDAGTDAARVVALLTDRRLLSVSKGTIELAHEALLREWPRLCAWIDADREGLRIHRKLNAAAREWEELSRDEEALYRGTRLTEAAEWRDARAPSLSDLEREFLAASEAMGARDRATRRRRMRVTVAAVATLAAGVIAIVVTVLFADRERDIAASRDLATKASTLIATDPGLAFATALQALRRSDTEQAQNAVRQAILAHRATKVIAAHKGLIFDIATSADGRLAATAGGDRTVRIWSVGSGRRVGEIRGYRDEVKAVSFSRDGERIASAALDGEIAVAAASGGARRVVTRLKHDDFARSIDFGAGRTLAIGTEGGRVALVRLSDGAVRDLSPAGGAPVYAVSFDGDARRVLSAGADGFARIWNVVGSRPLRLAHGGAVVAANFSPDGARVATAGFSGVVRLWDASSGRRLSRIPVSDQALASVRFSGDGRRVVTGAVDGVVRLSAVRGGAVLAEMRGHQGPARVNFVSRSGALVSAGEEDRTLRTWISPETKISTRPGAVPRFSRDGKLVVSGSVEGPIYVWNPSTGKEREFVGHTDVSYPQFSPDGAQIISAAHDYSVRLWDVATGRSQVVPTLGQDKFAAAIDASGKRIAIGGNAPLVIQAADGSARLRLRGHHGRVNALVFSPDSAHLLTGSDDGTAIVWNARSGARERTLRGHDGIVRGVAYSDDGQRIATTGSDGTVRVWPADGGDAVILVGHEGPANTASFDGRGDRLVSAGHDGTIRIWDAAGGDALVVLYRHEGIASGAHFSADGRHVVSAGDDNIRITTCEVCGSVQDALRLARTRAQHTLSAAERQRLLPGG